MVEENSLISSLFQTAREAFSYHKKRLKELQFRDYPFPETEELVDFLLSLDKQILKRIDAIENECKYRKKPEVPEQVIIRITRLGLLAFKFHSLLQILETGSREYIPQGCVVIIKKVSKNYPKSKFILLPLYRYNYAFQEIMGPLKGALRDLLPDIEKKIDNFAETFAVMGFPLPQKENVILNSLLGHELGHFIDFQKKISRGLLNKVSIDPKLLEDIVKSVAAQKLSLSQSKEDSRLPTLDEFISYGLLKARITDIVTKTIEGWLEELVADLIAFRILGPVFLFTLKDFLLTIKEIDTSSYRYPSPRMRIQQVIEEFEKLNYRNLLTRCEVGKRYLEVIDDLKEQLKNIKETQRDPIEALVLNSIEGIVPEIRRDIKESVAELEYRPEQFYNEVFSLIGVLNSFVTPVEISPGNPASPVSILNCGKLYELLFMKEFFAMLNATSPKKKLNARHKLHQLLCKALELSDVQSTWKKAAESL